MSELVQNFKTGVLVVTRADADGAFVDGRFQEGANIVLNIDVSAQPLTPKEVKILPAERREGENWNFYTEEELFINDQVNQRPADVVTYKGRQFEIHQVNDWTDTDLEHYHSIGMLVDPQGDA